MNAPPLRNVSLALAALAASCGGRGDPAAAVPRTPTAALAPARHDRAGAPTLAADPVARAGAAIAGTAGISVTFELELDRRRLALDLDAAAGGRGRSARPDRRGAVAGARWADASCRRGRAQ